MTNEEYEKTGKTYNIYKLTRREQKGEEPKQCPHLQFNIGSEYCRTCRYFVSHDHVDRIVKCSYPNPTPDPSLELFKNNHEHQIHYSFDKDGYCATQCPHCDFLLHVGSVACHKCIHFVSHDYKRQTVTCKCPENHKLIDFEPNILYQKHKQ